MQFQPHLILLLPGADDHADPLQLLGACWVPCVLSGKSPCVSLHSSTCVPLSTSSLRAHLPPSAANCHFPRCVCIPAAAVWLALLAPAGSQRCSDKAPAHSCPGAFMTRAVLMGKETEGHLALILLLKRAGAPLVTKRGSQELVRCI